MLRFRFLVWFIPNLFTIYEFLLQSMPSVMVKPLVNVMHLSMVEIGFLGASFFYLYLGLQIPAGFLVDRFKPRRLILWGLFLFMVGILIFATSQGLWQAMLGRFIMGISCAPAVVCAYWLAAHWYPKERYSTIVGCMEGMVMLAGGIGLYFLAEAVDVWGWRETLWIFLGVGAVLWMGVYFFVFDDPPEKSDVLPRALSFFQALKEVVRRPKIWLTAFYGASQYSVMAAIALLWGVPFVQSLYHLSAANAALIIALIFIGAGLGGPYFGFLNGRVGNSHRLLLGVSVVTLVLFSIWVWVPLNLFWFCFVTSLLGACVGNYVLAFALIREQTQLAVRGVAIGMTNAISVCVGAPFLQILIGYCLRKEVSDPLVLKPIHYQLAFISVMVVLAFGVVLSQFVKESRACLIA